MDVLRKTKIIATLGPSVLKPKVLEQLIKESVDVFRFNFSHIKAEQAKEMLAMVNEAERKAGTRVGILVDLTGPEIRTDQNTYVIKKGEICRFTYGKGDPLAGIIGINHPNLHEIIKTPGKMLLEDGRVEMDVLDVEGQYIVVKPRISATLKPRRAVNIPRLDLGIPVLNDKDKMALDFAATHAVHWIAASFVSSSKDVKVIRKYLRQQDVYIPIISKIESFKSVQNIDEIIEESEGIMVARGDLGVDFDLEEIPILQDLVIKKTKEQGKVIIVATQMLDSMITESTPRRSEVMDIAVASREKVDALMVSAETASGKYPVEAVKIMSKVISKTEGSFTINHDDFYSYNDGIADICKAGLILSNLSNARFLLCISKGGNSPMLIAANRQRIISVVTTENEEILARCRMYYSIYPIVYHSNKTHIEKVNAITEILVEKKVVVKNDSLVVIFTHPYGKGKKQDQAQTNSIMKIKIE